MTTQTTAAFATGNPARLPSLITPELVDLIDRSRTALQAACCAGTTTGRFVEAHVAALRAAAALLAWVDPPRSGKPPRNVWDALTKSAPEFAEWALFFAEAGARARSAQAGLTMISAREADDLVREAEAFLSAVLHLVGLPPRPRLAGNLLPAQPR